MDDNNELNYTDEEYEEALAKLNQSKSKREKNIVKEQKQKKRAASGKKQKKSFLERCKEDFIIPICVVAIILIIAGSVLYMVLPGLTVKTLDISVEELRSQYKTTQIFVEALQGFNFDIPDVEIITKEESLTVEDSTETTNTADEYNYFKATIPNTASTFATGIQGATSKSNGEIVNLRVLVEYSKDENFYSFMQIYFASYLQTIFPEMDKDEATKAILDSLNAINNGESEFTLKDDKAYRTLIGKDGDVAYVALDIIPADNLKK